MRQVKLLKHLQHENVVGLRDIMQPAETEIATFPVHSSPSTHLRLRYYVGALDVPFASQGR